MADRKMRMIKCGWKIASDSMQVKPDDKIHMREINLRCFLKVLFVNRPSHLIELKENGRPGVVFYMEA